MTTMSHVTLLFCYVFLCSAEVKKGLIIMLIKLYFLITDLTQHFVHPLFKFVKKPK